MIRGAGFNRMAIFQGLVVLVTIIITVNNGFKWAVPNGNDCVSMCQGDLTLSRSWYA